MLALSNISRSSCSSLEIWISDCGLWDICRLEMLIPEIISSSGEQEEEICQRKRDFSRYIYIYISTYICPNQHCITIRVRWRRRKRDRQMLICCKTFVLWVALRAGKKKALLKSESGNVPRDDTLSHGDATQRIPSAGIRVRLRSRGRNASRMIPRNSPCFAERRDKTSRLCEKCSNRVDK
jgi:hypothetical protein